MRAPFLVVLASKKSRVEISEALGPRFKVVVAPGLKTRGRTAYAPLHRAAGDRELVYLAMDQGPEGEGLAYRVAEQIGVTRERLRRVVFGGLSREEICAAIEAPRGFDPGAYKAFLVAEAARKFAKRLNRPRPTALSRTLDSPCPKCGGAMTFKTSRFGKFAACVAYPECQSTRALRGKKRKVLPTDAGLL